MCACVGSTLFQSGASFLQWPHHGAKNLTNTVLPAVSVSQVSGVSSLAEVVAAKARARRVAENFCF